MIKILERPSPQTPTTTLASHSPLGNLTSLYVDCPGLQTAEEVYTFLRCVVQSCRLLKALYLELLWMDIPSIYPSRDDRITFEILQPLLDCPNLMCVPLLCLARSATNTHFQRIHTNARPPSRHHPLPNRTPSLQMAHTRNPHPSMRTHKNLPMHTTHFTRSRPFRTSLSQPP